MVALDPFLPLRALSGYAGMSVRLLRGFLGSSLHPLPHYRVGGKILVRRSEFDTWMVQFRASRAVDVDHIVNEVIADIGVARNQR